MSDIALDSDFDLQITGDDIVLNYGVDAISQHLKQRLRTFYGEYFLNKTIGVPYFQQILKKNPVPEIVDSLFKKEIINTPGVLQLTEFSLDLDSSARELTLTFKVICSEGVIEFSEVLP